MLAEILGAAFTLLTCYCLGFALLRHLQIPLYRGENFLYSLVCGAAVASSFIFILCCWHAAFPPFFIVFGFGSLALARVARRKPVALPNQPRTVWGGWQRVIFIAVFATFAVGYLTVALAPEVSPDGGTYHLGLVSRYAREHGFVPVYTNFYAGLPQGVELLYLFAFAFGRHSAAALVHWVYWMALPWLVLSFFQRMGRPNTGGLAGILIFTAPIVALDGSCAYVDAFLITVLCALFGLLEIWRAEPRASTLVAPALLAGYAMAIKYTGYPAPLYLIAIVAITLWRRPSMALRQVLVAGGLMTAVFAPWLLRNWVYYRNPVFPFANRLFANPHLQPTFEAAYRKQMENYGGVHSPTEIALELSLRGGKLQGLFGPAFLLLPLGLLALRWPAGRRLVFAGALFLLPYPANIGTRFFMPAALFFSSAMAIALVDFGFPALLVGVFAVLTVWPDNMAAYCESYAWRISNFPVRVAFHPKLRLQYLEDCKSQDYLAARMLDTFVRPGERVLTIGNLPDAYTTAEVMVSFQGTLNTRLVSDLYAPNELRTSTLHNLRFSIRPGPWNRFRIVSLGGVAGAPFQIRELTATAAGRPLSVPRSSLTAAPQPWLAGAAADHNPVTAWSTDEPARAGMYLEFQTTGTPDTVLADVGNSNPEGWQLSGERGDGKWIPAAPPAIVEIKAAAEHLEDAALQDLKANGVRYIALQKADALVAVLALWRVQEIGRTKDYLLYKIP